MARNAVVMSAATMVSRVTGFVREMLLAWLLGATPAGAAYAVAIQFPNRLRQVLAEGAMSAAFIPMLAEAGKESTERLASYARRFLGMFSLIVTVVVTAGVVASPAITRVLAPTWEPERFQLAANLMRIIFAYLLLVSLSSLLGAVLNYFGNFSIPALAPALFNTALVITALGLAWLVVPSAPAYAFAIAWIAAGLVQVAVQLPAISRLGISLRPVLDLRDPLVLTSLVLLLPRILAYGPGLLNDFVAMRFATGLGKADGLEYPVHLNFAMRLTELVLGGFVTSVSTVILPTLSRHLAAERKGDFLATVQGALRAVAFITIPSAIALSVIGRPVVATLLERGKFDAGASRDTAYALSMYCVGLFGFGAIRILVPAFYALKDTWTPVLVAVAALGANVTLMLVLSGPLRHGGIALALAGAGYVNAGLLLFLLRRRVGRLGLGTLLASLARLLMAGGVMGAALFFALQARSFPARPDGASWVFEVHRVGHLGVLVLLGCTTYFAVCWVLRVRELSEVTDIVRRKLAARRARAH